MSSKVLKMPSILRLQGTPMRAHLQLPEVRLQAEAGTVRDGVYATGIYRGRAPSPNTFVCLWELGAKEGIQGFRRYGFHLSTHHFEILREIDGLR